MKSLVFSALLSLFATGANAADLTAVITDPHGVQARQSTDKNSPPVTIGDAIYFALMTTAPSERGQADPVAQAKRAALGVKVAMAKEMDFSADQVQMIKAGMGSFPPLWSLRVLEAIDPAALK